jgi:hypothetical protein
MFLTCPLIDQAITRFEQQSGFELNGIFRPTLCHIEPFYVRQVGLIPKHP